MLIRDVWPYTIALIVFSFRKGFPSFVRRFRFVIETSRPVTLKKTEFRIALMSIRVVDSEIPNHSFFMCFAVDYVVLSCITYKQCQALHFNDLHYVQCNYKIYLTSVQLLYRYNI